MKTLKIKLLVFFFILPFVCFTQNSDHKEKNEIGLDMTALIQQVISFGSTEFPSLYQPTYQLSYKRHFDKISARMGLGGSISSLKSETSIKDEVIERTNLQISYRLGIEKHIELNKRWQFYYGIDFRHSSSSNLNESNSTNGGWRQGTNTRSNALGIAPLLGLEIKISNRIFLQTESSYYFFYNNLIRERKFTQVSEVPLSPKPEDEVSKSSGFLYQFNIPSFLVLAIKF